jgi:hypothetical protein
MAETGKGRKRELIDAILSEEGRSLGAEDIKTSNVEVHQVSLKNQVVILDHDIDDPIMIINTVLPPEE